MDEFILVRKRELFDSVCCSVMTQLESFDNVSAIDFSANDNAQQHEIATWEKKNLPYKIPSDLKSFLMLFNGVHVSWKVDLKGKQVVIGELNVNRLDIIQRCTLEVSNLNSSLTKSVLPPNPKTSAAFTLESCGDGGQVVLLYRNPSSSSSSSSSSSPTDVMETKGSSSSGNEFHEPEVWFQDVSSRWHYICSGFTQYLRLSIVHFGIIGWQLAFTPEGLATDTRHWMSLFCPERLCIDLSQHATEKAEAAGVTERRPKSSAS